MPALELYTKETPSYLKKLVSMTYSDAANLHTRVTHV